MTPPRLLPVFLALLLVSSAAAGVPLEDAARLLAAEDGRDEHAPHAVRLLDAGSPDVRARAAQALGRIGAPRFAGPVIARLRRETEPRVREELCLALGGIARPDGTRVLVETLARDRSTAVRARAAQALGFIGGPLAGRALLAALPPPGCAVCDSDAELVWQIAVALFRLKDDRAVPSLMALAPAAGGEVARAATWALARMKAPRAEATLRRLLAHGDPYVRAWALRGLGDLGRATDQDLAPALASGDHKLRAHAIVAAGASRSRGAVPALIGIARAGAADPASLDAPLAVEAIASLGKIGDPRAVPALERLRAGPGVHARAADVALAKLKLPQRRFLTPDGLPPAGTAGGSVVDWVGWMEALGAHPAAGAKAALKRFAARDASPEDPLQVRTAAAVTQRAEAATKDDLPELAGYLGRADPLVRASAVESYGKLAGELALARFDAVYTAALPDKDEDARMALVTAAEAAGKDGRPLLERAAKDPSRTVRRAADRALAKLDDRPRPRDLGPHGARDLAYYRAVLARADRRPRATLATSAGTIRLRLWSEIAPLTVENFTSLARAGYFDGQRIPRVVPEFVVQIGDPRGDMSGGPGHTIRCEVSGARYDRGTVGMALSGKDTGGSQFFLMHTRHAHLEGIYTAFGQVEEGHAVMDRIVKGAVLRSVTID